MPLSFTSFAIVGAGTIGRPIAQSLSTKGVSVVVLSHSEGKSVDGIKTVVVNTSDVNAVSKALKDHKVEVVISTLGQAGIIAVQSIIAEGSRAAGVKLFVPSEWGMPTHGYTNGLFKVKVDQLAYIQSLGLATVVIYVGYFMGTVRSPTAFDINGKVNIVGNIAATGSFTAESDAASFTAHILTTLPPYQLANKVFRIEGQHGSMIDVATALKTTVVKDLLLERAVLDGTKPEGLRVGDRLLLGVLTTSGPGTFGRHWQRESA
ncbi:BHLH domain-containing protein [Mycena venus]|uniref:BHLH domain-containing protein n=1 Tax=Mycena venus TaxID=2733690 RepID=A0A8H7CQW4_9AGAR|nr:BHLH domain-containing protein [Mycena venus]